MGKGVGWNGSQFLILRWAYISNMSLLIGLEPFHKFAVGGGGGGGWSKGILEFHFGPNLGLRLEAGTKLNNIITELSSLNKHD